MTREEILITLKFTKLIEATEHDAPHIAQLKRKKISNEIKKAYHNNIISFTKVLELNEKLVLTK